MRAATTRMTESLHVIYVDAGARNLYFALLYIGKNHRRTRSRSPPGNFADPFIKRVVRTLLLLCARFACSICALLHCCTWANATCKNVCVHVPRRSLRQNVSEITVLRNLIVCLRLNDVCLRQYVM